MIFITHIVILLITYFSMEAITWFSHKYIMHGFLWILHEDHHQPKYQNIFEKNDTFFVLGAIPSIYLFYSGVILNLIINFQLH